MAEDSSRSSNSPRGDDCGDAEEEEDREQINDEKGSIISHCDVEGASCTNPPR